MAGRVLFVTRKFPPSVGGMETLAEKVWQVLSKNTDRPVLIAHRGSNRILLLWAPLAVLRSARAILLEHCDILLTGDALMFTLLVPLLRMIGTPATMVMGLDLTWSAPGYQRVVRRALKRARVVLAISSATAEVAVDSMGVPPDRVVVVRLGVSGPELSPSSRLTAQKEIHNLIGLTNNDIVLLTLGRLVRRKGVQWFVSSVLPHLPSNVHYLVAGSGTERDAIARAAAAGGVSDRCHLLGRVTNGIRETLLRGADIFVQPNIPVPGDLEGFGLVTIEAAQRGTLVVASDLEGIRDAVVDRQTGILLTPGDADRWISELGRLLGDPEQLSAVGALYGVKCRELYNDGRMAKSLLAAIQPDPRHENCA